MADLLEIARSYASAGLSVIPVGKDKKPRCRWAEFQTHIADERTLERWFSSQGNIAVVTGKVSGNLVAIDFDEPRFYQAWLEKVGNLRTGLVVQKAGHGFHVIFRCQEPVPNLKLAFVADENELDGRRIAIEIRGEGGYILVAPRIHPNGAPYTIQSGSLTDVPTIEQEQAKALLQAARLLDECPLTSRQQRKQDQARSFNMKSSGKQTDVIGTYNSQVRIAEILTRNGYQVSGDKAMRPGGSHFSVAISKERNRSYHHNSNDPLGDGYWHSPFDVFCLLGHQGNISAAVSAAAKMLGLNEDREQSEPQFEGDGMPDIQVNHRPMRDIVDDSIQALIGANVPPLIFIRSGFLSRIRTDEIQTSFIEPLSDVALRGRLARIANFYSERTYKKTTFKDPVPPPYEIVRDILSLGAWPFPRIEGLIETPTIRPDGSLLNDPGYDPSTRLYYVPTLEIKLPPFGPDRKESAVNLIQELMHDFPFADPASRANAIALLITPLIRPAITGKVPLALIDSPQSGTGKSLLQSVVGMLASGHEPVIITVPRAADEWRKKITATLMSGAAVISIDNLTESLDSGELAAAITAPVWSDRILGHSEMVRIPQRATWIANDNNLRLGGDLPRRCYWIRLDAQTSRPWQRDDFLHPDLPEWVLKNRGDLIISILTLAQGWFKAGQPAGDAPSIGGFSEWSQVIGGVLAFAGISGFLANLESLYEIVDDEGPQWENFLLALHEIFRQDPVTIAEICKQLTSNPELMEIMPDTFETPIEERGYLRPNFKKRLGKGFIQRQNTRYGDSQVRVARFSDDSHSKVARKPRNFDLCD
ncbi:MAG: hypothetical protein A2X25_12780 [Chloroflexi bacterium GWB2_49_20]|nr:MAG: hypothetical protein A2X25_12780 [Chloroflexi bacterium GWB2_49_20]OGN78407.1 MAG: hypothetical protein A2X26_01420 [Chloroflexi bacterium GWC2_49_37]OGN84130.1 MAG: hypothetical protein A2X27_14265 [Chloroflexi bacterium GWD2_49_16]